MGKFEQKRTEICGNQVSLRSPEMLGKLKTKLSEKQGKFLLVVCTCPVGQVLLEMHSSEIKTYSSLTSRRLEVFCPAVMLQMPLLLSLFARERGFYCFLGFCFSRSKHLIVWKEIITCRDSGLFELAILKYVLKRCLINKVHE